MFVGSSMNASNRIGEIKIKTINSDMHELIVSEKPAALRVARKILREWQSELDFDDVEGAVNLALCEAAKGYDPKHGTKFSTYLFFYIQGMLADAVAFSAGGKGAAILNKDQEAQPIAQEEADLVCDLDSRTDTPETLCERKELIERVAGILTGLSQAAQQVVLEVDLLEWKLAVVARKIGYSRGYLSEIRRQAHLRLGADLNEFKIAA